MLKNTLYYLPQWIANYFISDNEILQYHDKKTFKIHDESVYAVSFLGDWYGTHPDSITQVIHDWEHKGWLYVNSCTNFSSAVVCHMAEQLYVGPAISRFINPANKEYIVIAKTDDNDYILLTKNGDEGAHYYFHRNL